MAISEIPGGPRPVNPPRDDRSRETARARCTTPGDQDRISLSPEARSMYETSQESRLDEIREKVRSGFYDRTDVTEKMVEELLKDLQEDR
jgi:anti-sigma28 factor (negative regulator of flagellin synthesis)